jgi:DNA-binding NarL/FixJ family response regulator
MIKVLIVDDIPETRDHLSRLLGLERDIDVAGTAGSGEEAIQVALDMRPDVIVMDINMPGMDGIAASEIITQRLPNSAVIMMSVHGEAEHLKRAMLAGAREFLVKPGDSIDIVLSQSITVLQETADSAANTDENAPSRFEAVTGLENQRTVKAILQDKRVLYVSATRAEELEPTEDTNGDGVVDDNDAPPAQAAIDSVIIIFAGTDQDAEVIKFAQNALGEQGALTAVVRHADDDAVETTTGITIDLLVTDYGLRLPEIVQQLNEEATP